MANERRRAASHSDELATYVVRIYRREARRGAKTPAALVGLVEDVRNGERHAFHSMADLWALLDFPADGSSASRKPRRRNPS